MDENPEPGFRSNWGFCSEDPFQINCTNTIPDVEDLSDLPTAILEDPFCVDKLEANLAVEQPNVKREEFDPLLPKNKVFCAGRNLSYHFERDLFLVQNDLSGFEEVPGSTTLIVSLKFGLNKNCDSSKIDFLLFNFVSKKPNVGLG